MRRTLTLFFVFLYLATIAQAFSWYIPGVKPTEYVKNCKVDLKVNSLTSSKNRLNILHYDMPFCVPEEGIVEVGENLGEILGGDRIYNSLFDLHMKNDLECEYLCSRDLSGNDHKKFASAIRDEYIVHWILDNLPVSSLYTDGKESFYKDGFALGVTMVTADGKQKINFLYNHYDIEILVNKIEDRDPDSYYIVGFHVNPRSILHSDKENLHCDSQLPLKLDTENGGVTIFSYSVKWKETDLQWTSRWDDYLRMKDSQIHFFSLFNCFMILLGLTSMVALILYRVLRYDLKRYSDIEEADETYEETGWKLVYGDVFRSPYYISVLSMLVGTGMQLNGVCIVTIIFAVLGFVSPAWRGGLVISILLLYIFLAAIQCYTSSRVYKALGGASWKNNYAMTTLFYPVMIFIILFVVNFIATAKGAAQSVDFYSLGKLVSLYFGISLPLGLAGAYLGQRVAAPTYPVPINQIPRQIPPQVWYMNAITTSLVGGAIPFGAVFIELFFIFTSIWQNQFYYLFPFLAIVFVFLIILSAEVSIIICYFQLCSEDYSWWWRSFLTSGTSAFYLFLYSIFYYVTNLIRYPLVSVILYFAYSFVMSLFFFAMTGTVGFLACYWFTRKIYSSVKVD